MSELKTLVFDVDGTLADTERQGHRVAFNLAFQDAGLDWEWSEELYGELLSVTGGKERIRYYLDKYLPAFRPRGELAPFIAELHAAKTRHFTQMLAEGALPLRPGVERLLREARQAGLTLAIATTTTPANVEALLTHTLGPESLEWFAVIAAGDIVPAKKPAADIYHYALKALGQDATQALAFEDSAHGLQASLGAGLQTIVTVNAYTQDQDFSGALLVLDTMGEPEQPFKVLAGDALGSHCLDVELLRNLHAGSRAIAC